MWNTNESVQSPVTKNPPQSHTPGPWVANHFGDVFQAADDDLLIASCFGGMRSDANSLLIAAAPDLLALLQEIDSSGYFQEEYWAKISAAIAKAEGRS